MGGTQQLQQVKTEQMPCGAAIIKAVAFKLTCLGKYFVDARGRGLTCYAKALTTGSFILETE